MRWGRGCTTPPRPRRSPIAGAPEALDTFEADADEASSGAISSSNAEAHLDKVLRLLKAAGVDFAGNNNRSVVMAMLIAWAFCNRGRQPGDARYPKRALVVCPNLTIKERLAVLRPEDAGNYYDQFDIVPSALRPELSKGRVRMTNWHDFFPKSEEIRVGGVAVGRLGAETPEAFARDRLGDLWDDEPLMVLNDEGHHAYRPAPVREGDALTAEERADREEATVWVSGLDKLNAACNVAFCLDLSATPFYLHSSGYPEGSPYPWVVSDFGLVDAIESGITKIPGLPAIDNTGRPEPQFFKLWQHVTANLTAGERFTGGKPKPEVVYRKAEAALLTLAGQWQQRMVQNIAFEMAREVVRRLTDATHPGSERLRAAGRTTLLPQVLAITQRYGDADRAARDLFSVALCRAARGLQRLPCLRVGAADLRRGGGLPAGGRHPAERGQRRNAHVAAVEPLSAARQFGSGALQDREAGAGHTSQPPELRGRRYRLMGASRRHATGDRCGQRPGHLLRAKRPAGTECAVRVSWPSEGL